MLFSYLLFLKHSLASPCPRLFQTSANWQWQPVLDSLLQALEKHRFQTIIAMTLSEPQATRLVTALSHFIVIFSVHPSACQILFSGFWQSLSHGQKTNMYWDSVFQKEKEITPNRLAVSHPWGLAMPHTKWFLSKQSFFWFRQVVFVAPQLTKVSGYSILFLNLLIQPGIKWKAQINFCDPWNKLILQTAKELQARIRLDDLLTLQMQNVYPASHCWAQVNSAK